MKDLFQRTLSLFHVTLNCNTNVNFQSMPQEHMSRKYKKENEEIQWLPALSTRNRDE